jgi:DNA-binding YbaB/EbfC family protein
MAINPMDLFKNMQSIQSKVSEMQERLKEIVVTGSSGGGMVKIELDGQFFVRRVEISPEAVDPSDIEMLQDLVLAAFSDASAKIKEKMKEEASVFTDGMNLPPGLLGL